MRSLTMEGTCYIGLEELFDWLESIGTPAKNVKRVSFVVDENSLVVELKNGRRQWVEASMFWGFVLEKFQLDGYEVVFGVPVMEGRLLKINFAAGRHSDPRNWPVPPRCLAEWQQTAPPSSRRRING